MQKVAFFVVTLVLTLWFAAPAMAQAAFNGAGSDAQAVGAEFDLSNAGIVSTCLLATARKTDDCAAVFKILVTALETDGRNEEQIDQRLIQLTALVAQAAVAQELAPTQAKIIGNGLRVAADAVSNPAVQSAIIKIVKAGEANENFNTSSLETFASDSG